MRRLILILLMLAVPATAQTTDALWISLMNGNRVYVAGSVTFDHLAELRHESAPHQHPAVTVLSCSDSRVPPELVFDKSIDELFVIRVAGNIAGPYDLASIEYAIVSGYTKLIVVLGHQECGAVRAALDAKDPPSPNLLALVTEIRKSFSGARSLDPAAVKRSVQENAKASAAALQAQSKIIRDAVKSGKVGLIVAYYNLETGQVTRMP